MKIYLSGKITGDENYKAKFNAMAEKLKALGYAVFNPAILPEGFDYEDYMKIDLAALSTCDAILLMDNLVNSPGAIRERNAAEKMGIEIINEDDIFFLNQAKVG